MSGVWGDLAARWFSLSVARLFECSWSYPLGRLNTFNMFDLTKITMKRVLAAALLGSGAVRAECPDYTEYAQSPHGDPSEGALGLPYMRPDPACRTFNSSAVEKVISDMKQLIKDPDLARLFENTFPNTMVSSRVEMLMFWPDTTVRYFNAVSSTSILPVREIDYLAAYRPRTCRSSLPGAQWLRDTANQFAHYAPLLSIDEDLAILVKGVINNEARYVAEYPYCGAFQPPPESGLEPSHNEWADGVTVNPPVDNTTVFECKYELDSLVGFIKLSRSYYNATKDASIINDNWKAAIDQIFRVMDEQSQSTFDDDWNYISYYNWTGGGGALSPQVFNDGNGEPKKYTGMVGTHHRPSDDLSVFAFLTPANAMLSVELVHLADLLDEAGQLANVSESARKWSSQIYDAIYNYTVIDDVFAYETNGFGGRFVMDDANVPSLLSLPYLGFIDKADPAYVKTKDVLLSRLNPYYAEGKNFSGVGGPHVNPYAPWPMSQVSAIYGTDDDSEILTRLHTIMNTTDGLGLIHESISVYNVSDWTRPWFAWANSYFAEMVLDLAQRKPGLILVNDTSYTPGQ
ncbi:Six-hairpin glycosidase-like protein [Schizophyllum commune]